MGRAARDSMTQPQAVAVTPGRPRARLGSRAWLGVLIALGLLLAVWFALTESGLVSDNALVSPIAVFNRFTSDWRETLGYLSKTLSHVGVGFAIGSGVAILFALVTASVRFLRSLTGPPIQVLRSIPPFVLAPFFIFWFGYAPAGTILFVAWACFFIVYIDAVEAVKNVRLELRWAAASLGATRRRIFRSVVLPSIVPSVIGGLRVAVVASVNMALIIEFLSSSGGLGYMLIRGYSFFRLDVLFLAIIVAILATLLIDRIVALVGRYLVRWAD